MNNIKLVFVTVVLCTVFYNVYAAPDDDVYGMDTCKNARAGECPLSSQMTSCSPKCTEDNQCSPGTKCCPNICNTKSCSQPNRSGASSGGYKGSSSSATGTYCGNTKCNSYEKCEFDKNTKRQKCVRS